MSLREAYEVFYSREPLLLVIHIRELCLEVLLMVTIQSIFQALGAIHAANGHQDVCRHAAPHHLGGRI